MNAAEIVRRKILKMDEKINFLEFLVDGLMDACGPADGDIYDMLRTQWLNNHGSLPKGYEFEEE